MYIDARTVGSMFLMVKVIARCIHFTTIGSMHDELTRDHRYEVCARQRPSFGTGGEFIASFRPVAVLRSACWVW